MYDPREKARRDHLWILDTARYERLEGYIEGRKEGFVAGRTAGREEGERKDEKRDKGSREEDRQTL